MAAIPQLVQVPSTPMFESGVMSQAWYMFFFNLSRLASKNEVVDISELLQLASQLPTTTLTTQVLEDINELNSNIEKIPIPSDQTIDEPMPLASVFCFEPELIPISNINCCETDAVFMPMIPVTSDMQAVIDGT